MEQFVNDTIANPKSWQHCDMRDDVPRGYGVQSVKQEIMRRNIELLCVKGVVNCQNSRDKGPPEGNSARG